MIKIKIENRTLIKSKFDLPYLIAEAGVNHEGNLSMAKQMVEEVSKAGGDAIKFQAYKADTLASKHSPAYWDTSKEPTLSQYELFKKHDQFWKKEFEELADYCKAYKIDFLTTPFDLESADFLEPIVPAYKIASADITCMPLVRHIAQKHKPILLSTGAASTEEIREAVSWIQSEGNGDIVLLHCILNYPTAHRDANLWMIKDLERLFPDKIIGYSDHTTSEYAVDVLTTAWLLGAQVIEKHYTHNKKLKGNDHFHAMDINDLKAVKTKMMKIHTLLGNKDKNFLASEEKSRQYARRSLVALRNIEKGETIKEADLTWKRPGTGISPKDIELVIGKKTKRRIENDEILLWDLIE